MKTVEGLVAPAALSRSTAGPRRPAEVPPSVPVDLPSAAWGGDLVNALRRWWFLPLLLAAVGAAGAASVASEVQPSATAVVRVESPALDGSGIERSVRQAAVEFGTTSVLTAAGTRTPVTELRKRTQIAASGDSQTISITVTAPTAAEAVTQANAIAKAGVANSLARTNASLKAATRAASQALTTNRLSNSKAERARVARVGDQLATRQSDISGGIERYSVAQSAELAPAGLGAKLLALVGAISGGVLGGLAALLLGARRGSLRSAAEAARTYPGLAVMGVDDVVALARSRWLGAAEMVVLTLPGGRHDPAEVAAGLRDRLQASSGAGRHHAGSMEDWRISTMPSSPLALRLLAGRPEVVTLVAVEPKHTTHSSLRPVAGLLGPASALLVLDDAGDSWGWTAPAG